MQNTPRCTLKICAHYGVQIPSFITVGRNETRLHRCLPLCPPLWGLWHHRVQAAPRPGAPESLSYLGVNDSLCRPLLLNDILEASLVELHHQAKEQRGDLQGTQPLSQVPSSGLQRPRPGGFRAVTRSRSFLPARPPPAVTMGECPLLWGGQPLLSSSRLRLLSPPPIPPTPHLH